MSRELLLRYVWVDKYCIDQKDTAVKKEQLCRMADVYKNAYVTVFATEGHDSTYRLSGVSSRHRRPRQIIDIGQQLFTPVQVGGKDLFQRIEKSKWATRG